MPEHVSGTSLALVLATGDGSILVVLGDSETVLGWTVRDLIGSTLAETIVPHRYRADHRAGMELFTQTGYAPIFNQRLALFAQARDGGEHPVWLTVFGQDEWTGCLFALLEQRQP